jgi:hypothetical protein
MRIAVLPPTDDAARSAIETYLLLQSVRNLLCDHDLTVLTQASQESFDLIVMLGDRFLSDGFWDEWILGKPAKAVVLNLGLDPDRKWDSRSIEKMRAVGKQGGVSVVDETSFKKAREILGPSAVSLGGNPALFTDETAFALSKTSRIFCPAVSDPAFSGKAVRIFQRLLRRFYRRMNQTGRTLFMAHTPADFLFGASEGGNTIYEPNHPQLHLKALASTSSVVGFHPTALMAAVACGVPAVLIGNDPQAKNAVESAGIPFLEINPNTDPAELDHRAEEIIRKYPWETIEGKSGKLRANLIDHLKELGLKPRETKRRAPRANAGAPKVLHLGTILGRDDLATFTGFFENLQDCAQTEIHHHVLALDRATELAVQKTFPTQHVYLYRCAEIWQGTDLTPMLGPIAQRKFLMKPKFLSVLVNKTGGPVFSVDPSLFFYRDPVELLQFVDGGHTLFFPRWEDRLNESFAPAPYDTALALVSPGSEPLLEWWAKTAAAALRQAPMSGLATDPGFLALAPILFPGVRVYRAADHNIGARGSRALGVRGAAWPGNALRLADDRAVSSLHWQGEMPDVHFSVKVVWDQLAHFFAGQAQIADDHLLRRAIRHQQATHWPQLQRFLQGHELFTRNVPWFGSDAPPRVLAFFVSGLGRYPLGWLAQAQALTQTASCPADPLDAQWTVELQNRIFAPFRLVAARPAAEPAPSLAASA